MKITGTITAIGALLCLSGAGCGREESTSAPAGASTPPSSTVETVATEAKQAAGAAAEQLKQAAEKSATAVNRAAEQATGKQLETQFDQAKDFIAQKKYKEALTVLQQFNNLKLTPEQQKLLADLNDQAQKLLADDATKNVGGLLERKK